MMHWKQLVPLSDALLAPYDVAATNLACAADLPDAPSSQVVAECIDRLNRYARCTAHYTQKRLPEFRSQPQTYDNSEGVFRIVCMTSMLQCQFGVRYNPMKRSPDAQFSTADTFIHGALVGAGGTCASLPVLYGPVQE